MNIHYTLCCFIISSVPLFAQAGKLESTSLSAIDTAPSVTAPKFIPKSAGGGPAVEKSRNYSFAAKGTTSKAARVITMSDGTKIESPLVDIPLLFEQGNAKLKSDAQSAQNLRALAGKLRELQTTGACFSIEGHASAEGDGVVNQTLSEARAATISAELIKLGVSTAAITKATGFGSRFAKASASAPESELAADRRVLVLREK